MDSSSSPSSSSSELRLRLLEPATGAVAGGSRVVLHGKGFRPPPHSVLVRFRLGETGARVDVAARFLLETQLECVVPSFKDDARAVLARRTTLPPTAATLTQAPHLVPVQVEVIVDSDRVSNALVLLLHQEIAITKISPQFVLMTPPTTVTVTTNLLKLSGASRLYPQRDGASATRAAPGTMPPTQQELAEISSLPVFVRVRQVSERTSAVSERTVEARWRVSPVGVYEVEFDAVMMTFGDATVELTLNRHDFFRAKDKTPEAVGYCVHRDVTLASVDPCCVSVTSGRSTEVRLLGEGMVDSGDLTVRLLQRDIQEAASNSNANAPTSPQELLPIAQLSATFVNSGEIRCSVPPNMSFGLTHFQVSLNGGRQYGRDRASALLHRDRAVVGIEPAFASIDGNTTLQIRLARLTVDTVDGPHQIQNLVPPRRVRVRFEAVSGDLDDTAAAATAPIVKVVSGDIPGSSRLSATGGPDNGELGDYSVISCRVPSFFEEMKLLKETHAAAQVGSETPSEFNLVRSVRISLSLGGDSYFGAMQLGCFFPPVIQSMTRHHGPCSGGTVIILRMKYRVPPQLYIQVRFLQLATRKLEIVRGVVGTEYFAQLGQRGLSAHTSVGSPSRSSQARQENPASVIVCTAPAWSSSANAPVLAKVQVSYDGGFNFIPAEEEHELIAAGLASPRSKCIPPQLVKDMSYLYFLFYPVPRLVSVTPMSADIQGGSFIRIGGDHIVDHGGRISVVFQSRELSRKVVGFIENGELRCCVPPFNVGSVSIFVSFNGDQYTKCQFVDPDSKRPIDFVFYSSPLLQRLSPLCTSISHSSLIRIFGVNLIETGRVKVRFGFTNHSGKLVFKDVPARAQDGVIMAQSPLFSTDYGNLKAVVDVALNGNDFSGKMLSLYYYASYSIKRVEPSVGAIDIPIPVTIYLSQNVISDDLLVRLRFKQPNAHDEHIYGPIQVSRWESNRVDFLLPALCEFAKSIHDFEHVFVEVSFDKVYFHQTGDLLQYYRPYKLPPVITISPLVGHFEQDTTVVARCSDLEDEAAVTMTLTLEYPNAGKSASVAVIAEINSKRHTLTWRCPALPKLEKVDVRTLISDGERMMLPARLSIQMSTVSGQQLMLPFHFQYYRMPVLLSMSPCVGYICGGSLISFEFKEPIETPTIDLRFGNGIVTSARVRENNKRLVECLSPVLAAGIHALAMSFDEQYFEDVFFMTREEECEEECEAGEEEVRLPGDLMSLEASIPEETPATSPAGSKVTRGRVACIFQAFAMPHFTIPDNVHRVYGFGPLDGGSHVVIKGSGFIADGKIYVRFSSSQGDCLVGPNGLQSELVVKARVLDSTTILCTSPPSTRPGRVLLQVTYNLQQYTNSSCFFEYHERTKFSSRGIVCGPVSGGTPVCIQVEDSAGLPEDKALLRSKCTIRFVSDKAHYSLTVDAFFDEAFLRIECIAPPWPSTELVAVEVALSKDGDKEASPRRFFPTTVRFLFYDPPEGLITIEPSAGPITGGTEVQAFCGKMVDTGEIMVSVTIVDQEEEKLKALVSVGEDEEDEEDDDSDGRGPDVKLESLSFESTAKEVYLVKGRIVGEAVSFVTPSVSKPGVAYLNISLNGIDYTLTQTSTLRYKYFYDPVIRLISPTWSAMDTACVITLHGDFIEDHGCKPVIRFQQQPQQLSPQGKDEQAERVLVDGMFVDSTSAAVTARALQCSFLAPQAGYYEIQISLNGGQQFSTCKFMSATFGNYSGSARTALLPFRSFSTPFLLATPTGSVAGGSTVTLFMNKKLSKLLARETKCNVQFTPIRNGEAVTTGSITPATTGSPQKAGVTDGVLTLGEIDHQEAKITCRAPLLRTACIATMDLLLPTSLFTASEITVASVAAKNMMLTSCCAFFGAKEREKFHAYESPTITELAPSCGPLSGETCMVIECSNIVDTGQIFVRFRSSANERECILVPATFSRTFPDGSLSASPLLLCRTPAVEIIDRVVVSVSEAVSTTAPGSPTHVSGPRDASSGAMTSKARAHTYQQMAESSLRNRDQKNVLRVTRAVLKSAQASSIGAAISVLVDFTMNAGEQFIAHSVPFQFYPVIDPREIKWFPRHLPTQCFDRSAPAETRIVTIQLPKTLRTFTDSASAAERVSFYFEGIPQPIFSPTQKRRGSSIVLHETGDARELVVLDAPPPAKLRKESTMRRRSTFFRNSSISATSNNLLDSSSAALASSGPRPRAPIPRGAGPRRPSSVLSPPGSNSSMGAAGGSLVSLTSNVVPPSAPTSSPYIAAKIVKGGLEITCPVPEFGGCGTVKVFFSFNAQQFVCLGELHVHEPLTVRENRQHLFTSNIGGDRFTLFCSPSSVFDFVAPCDVLNEAEVVARQRRDSGRVKPSQALWAIQNCSVEGAEAIVPPTDLAVVPAPGGESGWRDRLFHVLQVHLIPPNPRVLRKLVVSARSVGSTAELATSSPDDFGCCVFETTEWVTPMLLEATPPAGSGVSSFSSVFPSTNLSCVDANGQTAAVSSTNRTHALLVHLPTSPEEFVVCCYSTPEVRKQLVIVNAEGALMEQATTSSGGEQCTAVSLDFAAVDSTSIGYYVCLDTQHSENDASSDIQVVVANAIDVQVYLTGKIVDAGLWVVAFVARDPSGGVVVAEIDYRVASLEDLVTSEALAERRTVAITAANEIRERVSTAPAPTLPPVTTCVQFSCADSSRNLSASGVAQLILSDAHTLASWKGDAQVLATEDLLLQCEMPALPFNGPTILCVQVDGVTFSNSLIVHCYDPRLWRITRIDPPCGLVHQPLKLRITGEHFVENRKTIVRFSDATRYQNFPAAMERYRLLIVRVASVRNIRSLLPPQFASALAAGGAAGGHSPQKVPQLQSQQNREGLSGHSPFIVVARVEYQSQVFEATIRESAVLAAVASSAPLGWEDQFEVQIPAHAMPSALLVVTLELVETSGNRTTWELGRTIVPTGELKEAVLSKQTYALEEHFRWRNRWHAATPSEVDVFLHLSPMMTQQDVFVCDVPSFAVPQCLRVQISSGDSFFSPCPVVDQADPDDPTPNTEPPGTVQSYRPFFQACDLPVVTDTAPRVVPRTAGGEILISGEGFIDCGGSHCIWVRLFACSSPTTMTEHALLEAINATASLDSFSTDQAFFIRDVKATFVSSKALNVVIPPRLATYNVYYRVSVDDGVHFSLASSRSHVLMYSADTVEPKGGPVSGNTYVAVHGSNLNACMALGGLAPVVKLTWMRGAKELEHIIVRGEFYPPEDIVYFYTPQSKFGLQNITVHVEVSLVNVSDLPIVTAVPGGLPVAATSVESNMSAAFGQDEIPFVIYRNPTIKVIAPLHSLVCGLSSLELLVQGLDEKATILLKGSIKARFKRRGQMQVADVHLNSGAGASSEGKLVTIVPRFVVGSAAATDVTAALIAPSPTRQHQQLMNRSHGAPIKVWTRQGAVYVVLLRARNLFVAKKTSTCNPFVVIHCNKAQLKSTRKDGTSSPVWNEIFDFDWRSETELPRVIRLSVENQISSNQSELLGQIAITFADTGDLSKPFCTRAWFPLRRVSSRGASNPDSARKRMELGDVEVAIAFIPVPPKRAAPRFLQGAALRTSILSAMQQQKKAAAATPTTQAHQDTPRSRKERLLRAFRRQGAPSSLVPSEIVVELAVNGQDFWSSAPSRCLAVSTPIVLSTEPGFVCMSGGTPLTLSGLNFVHSGVLRVAFAVVGTSGCSEAVSKKPGPLAALDSKRIVLVEARYRSSHCITCVTPPLQALGASDTSLVNVYVTINGFDFDSVALPLPSSERISEEPMPADEEETSRPRPVISLTQNHGEKYVINHRLLHQQAVERGIVPSQTLLHQVRVYLRPVIHRVRPADGVYTSSLVIEGSDFSNTGIVVARYCSKNDIHDVRTCRVNVISSERMECAMPDFPRGTVVTMSVAVNGLEFVPCPGEFAVFQSPRLTEIVPNWISVSTHVKQDLRLLGINLTTNSSASGTVQVSFRRGHVEKTIKGQCVDGEVLCSVPPELMKVSPEEPTAAGDDPSAFNEVLASIFVDVWLGGTHKTFTEQPLELHLYRNLPTVTVVAPTNGPIYGGYSVTIEGAGFINTGKIVARFQLLQEGIHQQAGLYSDPGLSPTSASKAVARQLAMSPAVFVDVSARFLSSDALVCSVPSFPQEGVYSVAVALNGVEFNAEAAIRLSSTWFIAWQNWQRRKQLTAQRHSLEMAFSLKIDEPAVPSLLDLGTAPLPATTASALLLKPAPSSPPPSAVVETAFGRRTTSRSSTRAPHPASDNQEPAATGTPDSPRRQREQLRLALNKMVDNESLERAEDHFVDLRLLQWHPATADDRSRSLAALLSDLFSAPETQQIVIRRIGVVFRVRGARDSSTGQYTIGSLSVFAQALKLVFPHVPDKQFEEVWRLVDPAQLGFVTLHSLTKRFIVTESIRPRSPEPGPAHYNPSYALVETKPSVPIILPHSGAPAEDAGLPSELFMNYDAFKAVRPRVQGGAFLKRELQASWCNPVPKEKLFQLETDEELERTFVELQQSKKGERLGSLASSPSSRPGVPRPPSFGSSSGSTAIRSKWKPQLGQHTADARDPEDDSAAGGGVSRAERLARAAAANETHASKLASPRGAQPASSGGGGGPGGRTPSRRHLRSILHEDIAPLYLKFLRSKEAQTSNAAANSE